MLVVLSKSNCIFCKALTKELDKLNVNYIEKLDPKLTVSPIICNEKHQKIYTGLPNKKELEEIIRKYS